MGETGIRGPAGHHRPGVCRPLDRRMRKFCTVSQVSRRSIELGIFYISEVLDSVSKDEGHFRRKDPVLCVLGAVHPSVIITLPERKVT